MKLTFVSRDIEPENLVVWTGANAPEDPEIRFEKAPGRSKTNVAVCEGIVDFRQRDEFIDTNSRYFVAVKGPNGKLVCKSVNLITMMPDYKRFSEQLEKENANIAPLSRRERLEEMKTKFGSKRTQRQIAQKRKYEIQFGEDDVQDLPTIAKNGESEPSPQADGENKEKDKDEEEKVITSILPKRNVNASKVHEVYDFRDIINDAEYEEISSNREKLFSTISNEFVKSICPKGDAAREIMAIFTDILLRLIKLTAHDLKKLDPMPEIEGDIKRLVLERFTTQDCHGRKSRYVITSENKDRINTYCIILLFILNKFVPINMETIKKQFKTPLAHLRKLLEVIGAYVESGGTNIKVAKLKVPLNMPKENKKFKG